MSNTILICCVFLLLALFTHQVLHGQCLQPRPEQLECSHSYQLWLLVSFACTIEHWGVFVWYALETVSVALTPVLQCHHLALIPCILVCLLQPSVCISIWSESVCLGLPCEDNDSNQEHVCRHCLSEHWRSKFEFHTQGSILWGLSPSLHLQFWAQNCH